MPVKPDSPPFIPPVEGCEIERVHRIGPFITRVDFRLPDGRPYSWTSRQHRWKGGLRELSRADTVGGIEPGRWWLEVGALARIGWFIAALFMVGSACFAIAAAVGLAPRAFAALASNMTTVNAVFFCGSICFTLAAWLQLVAAINADRIAAIAHRAPLTGRLRWFAWKPGEIGWLSAFVQFVGTLLFNMNTFDALLPGLDWFQEDLLIWAPDVAGSICFLVASGLAMLEYGHAQHAWNPRDVSWWVVTVNLTGSIAFGISAAYALVLPSTADLLDGWSVNAFTCLGALCFFLGAYLLIPELGRNVRRGVLGDGATGQGSPQAGGY